jgi:general L-amino acid transport system substrate-binding protein
MPIRFAALAAATLLVGVTTASAQTLKSVQERGHLLCGVSEGLPGFSAPDAGGAWTGFDVDFCRALSAAIFNDAGKVQFVPLSAAARFAALKDKRIDVLSRNSTWTLEREAGLGLLFAAVTYYDGQGFMARRALDVESGLELDGKKVCVQAATTNELNLADYFRNNRISYTPAAFPTADAALKAYSDGACDAFTSDVSQLHALRVRLSSPRDHLILADVISKEPLGPAVRQDDVQWLNVVKWTHFAMVNAEELGVGKATLDEALKSQKPDVRRLLGHEGGFGQQLGLANDWVVRIVRLVGNYGEVFERNVGTDTRLGIPRGINSLWDRGGLQYAPPVR